MSSAALVTPYVRPVDTMPSSASNEPFAITRRFVAMDVNDDMLASRLSDIAKLYAKTFNNVDAVAYKWSDPSASNLLHDRMQRPGSSIVLLDKENKNQIAGAFFGRIVPGQQGVNLSDPDVFIAEGYRGQGLGNELGFLGRKYANQLCMRLYGEELSENHSQTYKVPDFPKSMWQKHGYTLQDLFVQNAEELLLRQGPDKPPKVRLTIPKETQLQALADFMSNPTTITSDGMKWEKSRAVVFLEYMYKHNYPIMRVAENGEIAGLMVGDTIQRRTGSSLISLNGFISGKTKEEEITPLASTLAYQVVSAANTISIAKTRQSVTEIEVAPSATEFFRDVMPSLRIDEAFMNMSGAHKTIEDSLRPRERGQITITGFAPPHSRSQL